MTHAPAPRLVARDLTKVFARHSAKRTKGISMEGPAAFRQLMSQTFQRRERQELPSRTDKGHLWALDTVSFEAAAGEVLGIIGRNGAGKSTLLKILARVMHPTAGQVDVHGRVVSMLELGIGFAPELTVRQNIQIHGRLAGIPASRIRDAEPAILEFAGLTAQADVPLGQCAGGASVQLGFAAMIEMGAEIILADEVLAVGDTEFREACEARVAAAAASGAAVLFVSHDMAAIQRICTRVLWIDKGRLVRSGPPDDVVQAYVNELLSGRLLPPLTLDGLAASSTLLDVRLLDAARGQVGAMQLTEPGYIDCLFRVARPDVAVSVEIELWQRKNHVFTVRSQPVTTRQPATFRAGVRIPPDFFNEVTYQARVRLRVTDLTGAHAEPVVAAQEQLEFSAMNPHPERSVWSGWSWGRNGLIGPRLQWRLVRDAHGGVSA